MIGRKSKIRKNTQGKEQQIIIVIGQLAVSNSAIRNCSRNLLNWGSVDWNREALVRQTNKCNDIRKEKKAPHP